MKYKSFAAGLALCFLLGILGYLLPRKTAVPVVAPVSGYLWVPVIDAGHGGEDGGAVSRSGVLESTINLPIALKTEMIFRFLGIRTVMTRTEDISINDDGLRTMRERKRSDLRNRVRMVNEIPNAVLLSIHQNEFPAEKYRGAQIFYNGRGDSQAWAQSIQDTIKNSVNPSNKRVIKKAKDIYVMENVTGPAILAECGFLSNPDECWLLQQNEYQTKLAMAITIGFLKGTGVPERSAGEGSQ